MSSTDAWDRAILRRARLGAWWTECVAEFRRRGMVTQKSEIGYEDADECIGRRLLLECDNAVPIGWTVLRLDRKQHRGSGKPSTHGTDLKG